MLTFPFLECFCIGKLNFDAGAVTSSVASPTRPGIASLSLNDEDSSQLLSHLKPFVFIASETLKYLAPV